MKTKTMLVSGAALLLAALPLLAADVRNGLVAYWPMNTAPGSGSMTTPDVVASNDLQGPLKDGGTALVAGRFGNAINFAGNTSDYLYLLPVGDTGLPVAKQGSWSYCVWVNGASGQVNQSTFFAETTSGTSTQWRFGMESDGTTKTRTIIRDTGGSLKANAVLGNTNTLDSTWHHIAYTYDISTSKFVVYVDGQSIATNTFTYAQNAASFNQISVGALVRATVAVPFTGAVDDLALWARPLSQGEVQDVMTNSIATPIPAFAPTVIVNPIGATNLLEGDSFTLSGLCIGTRPFSYQWMKDGTNYPGPDANALPLSSLTTNDNGLYKLVFSNAGGSATSTVAQVTVKPFGAPNLTNGIIAYYPCDAMVAGYTPDLVSAYDMPLLGGMGATNIVAGKWGNALQFDRLVPQYGRKVFASGDAMPGVRRPNFSYSFWMKSPPVSGFIFAEASSTDGSTFLGIGCTGSAAGRLYMRTSTGAVLSDFSLSTPLFDDAWHNVIYSQHDIGGGTLAAQTYVDGVLDPAVPRPSVALQPDSLGFAINPRATLGGPPSGGMLDEIVYWNRALSPAEIALLQTGYITNAPTSLPPLAIASFTADLAAVVSGDSTVLRWSVPPSIATATISGIGDVKAMTVAANGSTNKTVIVTNKATYTLTITRGVETVSKSVTIGALKGVAAGWGLLDNFDFYNPGVLGTNGTWSSAMAANTAYVVQPTNQNRQAAVYANDVNNGGGAYLLLNGLTVTAGQARTLFFRITLQGNPAQSVLHGLGLTERVGNFYYQFASQKNAGPLTFPYWSFGDSAWWLGVSTGGSYVYDMTGLASNEVYKVWVDVTNVPIVNLPGGRVIPDEEDLFSVYIQKEGDPNRTPLFENVPSDRLLNTFDEFTTRYPDDNINKLYLFGNSLSGEVLFDDIYLSKTGILATTPIGAGYAGPPPTLQIVKSGSQWQVVFQGALQAAPAVTGTYTNVSGATSPYPVTTTGEKKFYRAVCY